MKIETAGPPVGGVLGGQTWATRGGNPCSDSPNLAAKEGGLKSEASGRFRESSRATEGLGPKFYSALKV